jgi:hypothetical protein
VANYAPLPLPLFWQCREVRRTGFSFRGPGIVVVLILLIGIMMLGGGHGPPAYRPVANKALQPTPQSGAAEL